MTLLTVEGTSGVEGYEYIWQGDKWQSSPDGSKGHDFTYWTPMNFDQDGNVKYLNYTANFTVDVISDNS